MSKKILFIAFLFVVGMVGGIFADQIFWPYFIERPLFYKYRLEQSPIYVSETKQIIVQENTALVDAIENVSKSLVAIRAKNEAGVIIEGSGLIITSDGLMVAFADLAPQGYELNFFIDGEEGIPYQVLKRNAKLNLALIKLQKTNLQAVRFAELEKLKIGERVFLVGTFFDKGKPGKSANEGAIRNFTEDIIRTNISEKSNLVGSALFNISGETLGLNRLDQDSKIYTLPISKIRTFVGL